MIGKVLIWVYVIGYFGYLAAAGIDAWDKMEFFQWRNYMAFQLAWYAPFWPVTLGLNLLGLHWSRG